MLCLALRSSAQQVYDRALRQFTVEEVSEAFAAARGLALPSQLRRALRAEGRDLHGEFLRLLPERPRPIKVQRWTLRRVVVALVTAILVVLLVLNAARLFGQRGQHPHPGARRRRLRRDGADVAAGAGRADRRSSSRAWPPCPWVGRSGC